MNNLIKLHRIFLLQCAVMYVFFLCKMAYSIADIVSNY